MKVQKVGKSDQEYKTAGWEFCSQSAVLCSRLRHELLSTDRETTYHGGLCRVFLTIGQDGFFNAKIKEHLRMTKANSMVPARIQGFLE